MADYTFEAGKRVYVTGGRKPKRSEDPEAWKEYNRLQRAAHRAQQRAKKGGGAAAPVAVASEGGAVAAPMLVAMAPRLALQEEAVPARKASEAGAVEVKGVIKVAAKPEVFPTYATKAEEAAALDEVLKRMIGFGISRGGGGGGAAEEEVPSEDEEDREAYERRVVSELYMEPDEFWDGLTASQKARRAQEQLTFIKRLVEKNSHALFSELRDLPSRHTAASEKQLAYTEGVRKLNEKVNEHRELMDITPLLPTNYKETDNLFRAANKAIGKGEGGYKLNDFNKRLLPLWEKAQEVLVPFGAKVSGY